MAIVTYAPFDAVTSYVGRTAGNTVRASVNPKDANARRQQQPPDDNAPMPPKGGINAAPMSTSELNCLEDFGGGSVGPKIFGTRIGRKDCQQEGVGEGGQGEAIFSLVRDRDIFYLVRLVDI